MLTFYLIIIQHYISIYVINVLVMISSFYIIIMIYQSMVFFSYVVDGVPKQISLVNSHTLLLTYSCCPVYKIFHCLLFCIELSSDTMQLCSLHMYIRTCLLEAPPIPWKAEADKDSFSAFDSVLHWASEKSLIMRALLMFQKIFLHMHNTGIANNLKCKTEWFTINKIKNLTFGIIKWIMQIICLQFFSHIS